MYDYDDAILSWMMTRIFTSLPEIFTFEEYERKAKLAYKMKNKLVTVALFEDAVHSEVVEEVEKNQFKYLGFPDGFEEDVH